MCYLGHYPLNFRYSATILHWRSAVQDAKSRVGTALTEVRIVTDRDPRPNPDVIAKRLDDAAVLVHLGTNRIFELNGTGMRVWELLGQGLGVDGIVRRLV